MLIEFSVENFRSIKGRQVFSMVAGVSAGRQRRRSAATGNSYAPMVLKSACIFGPNGAGKTSLINALSFFQVFVSSSAKHSSERDGIPVTPFKSDPTTRESPSEFQVIFAVDGVVYQYGFAADRDRVTEEWLFSRNNEKNSRMRRVFQRAYDHRVGDYVWDISEDLVRGEREVWRKSTRKNALFLSTAIQLNAQSLFQPYRWISEYLRVVRSPDRIDVGVTARASETTGGKDRVLRLLRSFGLPIVDYVIDQRELNISDEMFKVFNAEFLESLKDIKETQYDVTTFHSVRNEVVKYNLRDESDGTRVIFSLAGPLIEATSHGFTVVIDELHNSLHPLALRFLVDLFHDEDVNTSNAQLIFTSHDTAVMSKSFLHRDQVWLAERSEEMGSVFTPLSDFDVKEMQSFQRAYLGGKFGALPKIRRVDVGQKR